jgi:uncharacterized membrane protein
MVAVTTIALAAGVAGWAVARRSSSPDGQRSQGFEVERSVTVTRPPEEVYRFWRDLEHLPTFMSHLESVAQIDEKRSRWVARGPGHMRLQWEAEIVADEPGRLIAWRSLPGGDVENAGWVRFSSAPAERGTEVKVHLTYAPPAGMLGGAMATLLGQGGDRQVRGDLRRFKQQLEAREVATSGSRPAAGRGC